MARKKQTFAFQVKGEYGASLEAEKATPHFVQAANPQAGDTVDYRLKVTNTGKEDLYASGDDPRVNGKKAELNEGSYEWGGREYILKPSESAIVKYTYTLTEEDAKRDSLKTDFTFGLQDWDGAESTVLPAASHTLPLAKGVLYAKVAVVGAPKELQRDQYQLVMACKGEGEVVVPAKPDGKTYGGLLLPVGTTCEVAPDFDDLESLQDAAKKAGYRLTATSDVPSVMIGRGEEKVVTVTYAYEKIEAQPEPEPGPKDDAQPDPKPQPGPKDEPAPQLGPKPDSKPKADPVPKEEPKAEPAPKTAPAPKVESAPKSEARASPKIEPRTDSASAQTARKRALAKTGASEGLLGGVALLFGAGALMRGLKRRFGATSK